MAELPPQTLKGKTAIVTGATRGLGAEMALDLARRGANVVINYTSEKSGPLAEDLINQIEQFSNEASAISVRADLSSTEAASIIVDAAVSAFSKIDILVNNAALQITKSLREITLEDYQSVYDVNIRAVILLTQACLPHLRAPARIINISSVGGRSGFASLSLYTSSKAALEGLTRSWAGELGHDGTTVNAVAPGPVQSEMLDSIPEDIKDMQKKGTPVQQRFGTPKEICDVVSWLASEESGWISGQTINASGGWTMY